jgi:predicted metalloprotease with PDZ domain
VISAVLAAVAALLAQAAAAPSERVEYRLTPVVGTAGLERIEVELRFLGDPDGETQLDLPDRWAGTSGLHEGLRDLRVQGGTLSETGNAAQRFIDHARSAPLVVRYSLALSAADPGLDYEKARPVLRPGWFYVHGEGALATPNGRGEAPARFSWGAAPAGWQVASNLDGPAGATLSVDDAVQSIFAGGTDLHVIEKQVGGQPLRIAVRGQWAFEADALGEALGRLIEAENRYMDSPAIPFFVSLIPQTGGDTGAISLGGTGRTSGFALASTTNVDLAYLLRTLGHEYGHRWFGRSLGPTAEPEGEEYWFTEGFNDFVAAQSLVAAGLWDERAYGDSLNDVLRRYGQSPARARSNAETAAAFWQDNAAQQMLYDRGHLFALLLAHEAGGSRHVREALARVARDPGSFAPDETQGARFARAFQAVPATRLAALREAAIIRGQPIALPADTFAPCGIVEWTEQPLYSPGYTAEDRPEGRFFATVDAGSPAWAAGLRPGMRYVRRESFRPGDSTVPIVMRVADADGERVLQWLPQGRERVRFQRLELRAFAAEAERGACRSTLAGN